MINFTANSGTLSEYLKRVSMHTAKNGPFSYFWIRIVNNTLTIFGQDGATSLSADVQLTSVEGSLALGTGFIVDRALLDYLNGLNKRDVSFSLTPPESADLSGSLVVDGAEFYVKSDFDYPKPPEDAWETVATFGGLNFVQALETAVKFTTKTDTTAGVYLRFDKGKAALYATDRSYAMRSPLEAPQALGKAKDLIFSESYVPKIAAILSEKLTIQASKTTDGYFQIVTGPHKLTFGSGDVKEYPIDTMVGAFGHRDEISAIFDRRELIDAMEMALIFIKSRAHNPVDITFNRADLTFTISVSGTTGKAVKTYSVIGFNGEPDADLPDLTLSASRILRVAKNLKNTDMIALNLGGYSSASLVVEFTEHPSEKDGAAVVMAGIAPGNETVETDEDPEDSDIEVDFDYDEEELEEE